MAEVRNGGAPDDAKTEQGGYRIVKQTKSRWWEVLDPAGELVCLTVYRRGAREVVRRLAHEHWQPWAARPRLLSVAVCSALEEEESVCYLGPGNPRAFSGCSTIQPSRSLADQRGPDRDTGAQR